MANRIFIEFPRTAYFTGEVVTGTVHLEADREVPTRGLHLDILGRESTEISRGSGEDRRTYRSRADDVAWRLPLAGEGTVPPGVHRFPFQFQIPVYALPTYAGHHAKVRYTIEARLDVPWWPDATWVEEVHVFLDRRSVRTYPKPIRFRSGGQGPEIYVEVDGDRFFARELIGCRVTILRLGDARVRRAYIRLIGGEWARADSAEETTTVPVAEYDVPMSAVRIGEPFTIEIPIPSSVQSSYRGTFSYYSYVLQVGLDIAWATDLVAETPIVIVR